MGEGRSFRTREDTVWDEVIKQDRNQRGRGVSVWHRGLRMCRKTQAWNNRAREPLGEKPWGSNRMGLPPLFNVSKPTENIFYSRPLSRTLLTSRLTFGASVTDIRP